MSTYFPAKLNTQWIGYSALVSQANTKIFQQSPTLASGDFKTALDGGTSGNLGTLPTNTPGAAYVKFTLSTSEMNGGNATVMCVDAAGAEWCDLVFNIPTAARQIDDLAFPATSGRSMVVDAAGLVDANTVKLGASGSGTAQTARDIGLALPAFGPGAAGGLFISGSNTGTTTVGAWTVTGKETVDSYDCTNAFRVLGAYSVALTTTFTGAVTATSASNDIRVNVNKINNTSIAGTGTRVADVFTSFFNVASATGTVNSLPAAIPGAAAGLFIAGSNAATTAASWTTTGTWAAGAISCPAVSLVNPGGDSPLTITSSDGSPGINLTSVSGIAFRIAGATDVSLAGDGRIHGTVDTVTAVTTVNGLAANSITAAAAAADFGTEVGTAVWASATRTLTAGTNIVLPSNGLSSITAWTVDITGSLSGSVGSVTGAVGSVTGSVGSVVGAVGSVTGAVGSVTGNVGGNVVGTVASVVGAVGSVTGNVGGNVTGTVASVVGNVGGSVGSVTGNVGGNVTGSVGSIAAGGIASTSFAANSITSTALATNAVTEISDAVRAGIIVDHGAGSYVPSSGTGAFTVTITVTDGAAALQNVTVSLTEGANHYVRTTNVSGVTGAFNLDAADYVLALYKVGYDFAGATITVSADANFNKVMTVSATIPVPTNPNTCNVAGYIYDGRGLPQPNCRVKATPVASTPITSPIVATGGTIFYPDPVSALTDTNGYVIFNVTRTSVLTPAVITYTFTADNGTINKSGVLVTTSTLNLNTL